MNATQKIKKQMGLLAALTYLVGSVVGIGIFFKNGSIARATSFDGIGWVMAWILGGIVSLSTAVSYSEIVRLKPGTVTGLSSWSASIYGKKFGHFIAVTFIFLNLGIDVIALAYFAIDFFWEAIGWRPAKEIGVLVNLVIGFGLVISLLLIQRGKTTKVGSFIQISTTFLKLIPLFVGAFVGLIIAGIGGSGEEVKNAFVEGPWTKLGGGTRALNVFVALPAVLFAYDSFLNVGFQTNRIKNGEKRMPWIIMTGILLIGGIYTMVAVSSSLTSQTSVSGMVQLISSSPSVKTGLGRTINFLIFFSALGVTNGFAATINSAVDNMYKVEAWFGTPKIKARFGEKGSFIYTLGIVGFWFILLLIISQALQTDVFIDGFSNYPTTVFFFIYSLVIFGYIFKRGKFASVKKISSWLFWTSSIFSIVGVPIALAAWVGSQFKNIAVSEISTIGWGGGYANGYTFSSYLPLIILFAYIALMFAISRLNVFLAKKLEGRDVEALAVTGAEEAA